jgi:oxygen-independent coproporphyrinogen-3 oxidase
MSTEPLTVLSPDEEETTAGNYFVSNYPPYSFWTPDQVPSAFEALNRPPAPGTPLGVYLHIPFCRKRCHFCYFKVYTDKNAQEIETYLDAAVSELALYAQRPFIGGRKPRFIYFGGGTPSYISSSQLERLVTGMKKLLPWDEAEEVAFECEPGTLTEGKIKLIRELGVTRLSLGIEHFDETILQINGRAHGAREIHRSYNYARKMGFPQINIDLIAGMVGDTPEKWRDAVRQTIALDPDSVTIYQMEVPYNTTIFKEMKAKNEQVAPVAPWRIKREWVEYAWAELERHGYGLRSAYTAVKDVEKTKFVYTDMLWQGADMIGLGVASFSHIGGVHYQNEHDWEQYLESLAKGRPPIYRAMKPTGEERLIREFILQLKRGKVVRRYFEDKFGVDLPSRFAEPLGVLKQQGFLSVDPESLRLNREGLLQVDRLLHEFFLPEHRNA